MAQVDVLLGMKISQEGLLPREARSKHYCSSQSAEFFQILKQIPSGQMLWESDLVIQVGMESTSASLLSDMGKKVLRQDWEGKDPPLLGKWWKVAFFASNLLVISHLFIVAVEIWLQWITACPPATFWWSHIYWVEEKSPAPCFFWGGGVGLVRTSIWAAGCGAYEGKGSEEQPSVQTNENISDS